MKNHPAYYIGKRISKLRMLRGFTQYGFAKKVLDMRVPQLAKIEHGVNMPRQGTLNRLEDALEIKRGTLLSYAQRMTWRPPQEAPREETADDMIFSPDSDITKEGAQNKFVCDAFETLEELARLQREHDLPSCVDIGMDEAATKTEEDGILAARRLRAILKIGTLSFKHALWRLRKRNVHIICRQDLPHPLKSLPFYNLLHDNFVIYINEHLSPEEQLRQIAFCLGQLIVLRNRVLRRNPLITGLVTGPFPSAFTDELLFPEKTAIALLDDLSVGFDSPESGEDIRAEFDLTPAFFNQRVHDIRSKVKTCGET